MPVAESISISRFQEWALTTLGATSNGCLPSNWAPQACWQALAVPEHKDIFRSRQGQMYVVSLSVRDLKKAPQVADLPNLQIVLTHVEQLHCDMFESALLPVALTNKLVSLLANPSSQILRAFAKSSVSA